MRKAPPFVFVKGAPPGFRKLKNRITGRVKLIRMKGRKKTNPAGKRYFVRAVAGGSVIGSRETDDFGKLLTKAEAEKIARLENERSARVKERKIPGQSAFEYHVDEVEGKRDAFPNPVRDLGRRRVARRNPENGPVIHRSNGVFTVHLQSRGNPDYSQDARRSLPGVPDTLAHVNTLKEAQSLVRQYIEFYDLGGGNWSGGEVVRLSDGLVIGRFSYNGRLWSKGGKQEVQVNPVRVSKRRRNPTTWGTSYFETRRSAEKYYADYEDDPKQAVERKLAAGEIHVGKPPLKPGDKLVLNREEGRWFVTTGNPVRVRKLPRSSKYRVASGRRVHAFATSHARAMRQAGLLRGQKRGFKPTGRPAQSVIKRARSIVRRSGDIQLFAIRQRGSRRITLRTKPVGGKIVSRNLTLSDLKKRARQHNFKLRLL